MREMNKAILIILGIVVVAGGVVWGLTKYRGAEENEQVFCTMDAKLCPDGSYVGRQGPRCEFAPCP